MEKLMKQKVQVQNILKENQANEHVNNQNDDSVIHSNNLMTTDDDVVLMEDEAHLN